MHTLSKSKYLTGLTCPRLFWMTFHQPEKLPAIDDALQARFEQGREIGTLAKKRWSDGVDLEALPIASKIQQTIELLTSRKPIFEAAFSSKGTYCQVDALVPSENGWDIVEVKSSASVKDEHILDVAFQRHCLGLAGINVERCRVMHLNSQYVYDGALDVHALFTIIDVSAEVDEMIGDVPRNLKQLQKILALKKAPEPKLGEECLNPGECPVCLLDLPADNVTELTRFKNTAYDLINNDIVLIKDIPANIKLNDKQRLQVECVLTGKPAIDRDAVRGFLKKLIYPVYCIDFETTNPAIPLFVGMRPYQQIPFQVSIHVIEKDGSLSHIEWLAQGNDDPRPGIIETLRKIGPVGTVLSYNKSFEEGRIKELAETYPDETWLLGLLDRMQDLIVPFRSFWYYHPLQRGSCSMKAVLPALTGRTYKGMEISQGDQAAREFLEVIWRGNKNGRDTKKLRAALLEYCGQDTLGMVEILEVLGRV
ncbi:DUF2779 domain-containing protein [Candidatus Woesearchaeota archaeon]|nr:DUF2779 domain-containing protein [Candidatus Woesearchaeota archaeon]